MSRPIIEVESISKRYNLGQFNAQTMREEVEHFFRRFRKNDKDASLPRTSAPDSEFWALRDVSFSVQPGEVVGIIGRNGAGKSTLLKILSRVTEPTRGEIRLRGRVASLLEVGTGFHPDLTGRENIYLNGTILGMTKAEVDSKFDEIVAFAEIERFLDTPVKRYSSGMYVRLAFAVAAHLEPEILIVDEVLAVGDAEFQKKCLGKMKSVSRQDGRTVLFVSHNMGAIQSLCSGALVLEHGLAAFRGGTNEAVSYYSRNSRTEADVKLSSRPQRKGTGEARILRLRMEDESRAPETQYQMGESLTVIVEVEFTRKVINPVFGLSIIADTGIMVADCRSSHGGFSAGKIGDTVEYSVTIDPIRLYPRRYTLEPWVTDANDLSVYDRVHDAAQFDVTSGPKFLSGANVTADHGIVHIPTTWTVTRLSQGVEHVASDE
jgi:lipopolysaccharide transport system ATP-binding protein